MTPEFIQGEETFLLSCAVTAAGQMLLANMNRTSNYSRVEERKTDVKLFCVPFVEFFECYVIACLIQKRK